MGETKIEWTRGPGGEQGYSFNPWLGCSKVSPGCENCYAEGWARRSGLVKWGPDAARRRTVDAKWRLPLLWDRRAKAAGIRSRVFCASLADVFDNEVPSAWRDDLWALVKSTPDLDWLVVTKRVGNARAMFPADWGAGWPNVWLLATVCNQEEADRDIPKLLKTPAKIRGLSMEPLLGPVDLAGFDGKTYRPWLDTKAYAAALDWVIVGGESGPKARPMDPEWAVSLRDQCEAAGVPFFFKQWGEWAPASPPYIASDDAPHHLFEGGRQVVRIGKKRAGRLLEGRVWDGHPKTIINLRPGGDKA